MIEYVGGPYIIIDMAHLPHWLVVLLGILLGIIIVSSRIEWVYLKTRKLVTWTNNPAAYDTFAMMEIRRTERKRGAEITSAETKEIINKWIRRQRKIFFWQ